MKICVINFSGNVGKSIVSQHLLKPRIENSNIISVESINSDGTNDEKIKGKRFTDIMNRVLDIQNVIVDVGASNVEDFLQQMKKSIGSQDDFDYFVVPTIFKNKQITDTVATIDTLNDIGIEKERIKVIFNMLDEDSNLLYDFKEVFVSIGPLLNWHLVISWLRWIAFLLTHICGVGWMMQNPILHPSR